MQSRDVVTSAIAACLVAVLLAALSNSSVFGGGPTVATTTLVLTAGHTGNTDEPYHLGLQEMARLVSERSEGRVEIVIYPSMQLGGEKAMIEGLLLGTLDIVVTANGSATNFVPRLGMLDLPFLFRDREHMYRALDGDVGEQLRAAATSRGLGVLAFYDAGVRHIMTSDRQVNSLHDLQGLKIRTMPVPAHIASFNAFGANAVAVDYGELYGGLQTGLVDGAEAANTNYVSKKFYEVAPNWAQVGWIILVADVMVSRQRFESFPADVQAILLEAAQASALLERELYASSDARLVAELESKGVKLTRPDIEPFRAASTTVYEQFVHSAADRQLLQTILQD